MSSESLNAVLRTGILPIARGIDPHALMSIARVFMAEDISVMEVTLNSPNALDTIQRLVGAFHSELVVGAGTVLDAEMVERAARAGAAFIVSPHVDTGVITAARRLDLPVIPGALSPTEILQAWTAGAALVKVFPAETVGPRYLRHLRGPLPEIPLVPTGGISPGNAKEFMASGAAAVGIGGSLLGPQAQDAIWLRRQIRDLRAAVEEGRAAFSKDQRSSPSERADRA